MQHSLHIHDTLDVKTIENYQHTALNVNKIKHINMWLAKQLLRQGWKISWYFRYIYIYIYQAFAHTLLKLYEIYYQIIVCACVCALHIRWSTLVIHTALLWRGEIWQKLSNTEKMLRAQVISQQNTPTENQNVVTMCHIKKYLKNSIKIENIENIRYFRTKISDIYLIYINDIYRRYISSQTCTASR